MAVMKMFAGPFVMQDPVKRLRINSIRRIANTDVVFSISDERSREISQRFIEAFEDKAKLKKGFRLA